LVNNATITALSFALVISILPPIVLLMYFRKKAHISFKVALVGALTFVVFSQILGKLLHIYVFTQNSYTMNLLKNPWIFTFYGALAAGVFEGTGRYISLQYLLKNRLEWKDGLAFGIGYGGIEAILIGASAFGQLLYFALLLNAGTFHDKIAPILPPETIAQIEASILGTPAYIWLLGGLERILALTFQIAMAIFLLYGVRQRKPIYLVWVIAIHSMLDFFPAMYQAKIIGIAWAESILAILWLGALVFVRNSKQLFIRQ